MQANEYRLLCERSANGGMVANSGIHLGMNAVGCDPFLSVAGARSLSRAVRRAATFDDIYAEADYITLQVLQEVVGSTIVENTAYGILIIVEGNEYVALPSLAKNLCSVKGIGVLYAANSLARSDAVCVVGIFEVRSYPFLGIRQTIFNTPSNCILSQMVSFKNIPFSNQKVLFNESFKLSVEARRIFKNDVFLFFFR